MSRNKDEKNSPATVAALNPFKHIKSEATKEYSDDSENSIKDNLNAIFTQEKHSTTNNKLRSVKKGPLLI